MVVREGILEKTIFLWGMDEEEGQGQRLRFSTPSAGPAGTKTLGQDEDQCALDHEESRHYSKGNVKSLMGFKKRSDMISLML